MYFFFHPGRHLHLITSVKEGTLSNVLLDYKKFTSKQTATTAQGKKTSWNFN